MEWGRGSISGLLLLLFLLCSNSCTSSAESYKDKEERRRQEADDERVHCSRARSRTAHTIIAEYLMPFVEAERYNLSSSSCRLHPHNDLFWEQEQQVEELRPTQWQCGYCKKIFRSREFLDTHFDNRHSSMLDKGPNRCLADLCGALHCDYFDGLSKSQQKKRTCKPAVIDRNRHLCEVLASSCFPPEGSASAHRLNDFFKRQFCDAHTCSQRRQPFPRGSGIRNRSLYFAVSLFTLIVLAIFYGAVYAHKREMRLTSKNLQRLSQRPVHKLQKSKPS